MITPIYKKIFISRDESFELCNYYNEWTLKHTLKHPAGEDTREFYFTSDDLLVLEDLFLMAITEMQKREVLKNDKT